MSPVSVLMPCSRPRRQMGGTRRAVLLLAASPLLGIVGCHDSLNGAASPSSPLSLTCSVSPTSGIAPLSVALSLTVQGGDPSFGLQINYGDGASGSNPDAIHVYERPGSFTLSASLGNGTQSASCSQTITVAAPPPSSAAQNRGPSGRFKVSPNPPFGPTPLTVLFNMCAITDPEGDPLTWTYSFGDGATDSGACSASHTYVTPGTYFARHCVTDGLPGHEVCKNHVVGAR